MLRGAGCVLHIWCSADLRKFAQEYDLDITEQELKRAADEQSIKHIPKKKFKKLNGANLMICIDKSVDKLVTVDSNYFTPGSVGRHMVWQQRSST